MTKPLNASLIQQIVELVVKQGGTKFATLRKEIDKATNGAVKLTSETIFVTSDEGVALVPELEESLDFIAYVLPGREDRSFFLVPAGTELEVADDSEETDDAEAEVETDNSPLVIDESMIAKYFVSSETGIAERATMAEACSLLHAQRASGTKAEAFGAVPLELNYTAILAPLNVPVDVPAEEEDEDDSQEG